MDVVRGLACVVMIVWHTADAWLGPDIHGTAAFERTRFVGGFAAPLFVWLAGLSSAISTELRPSLEKTLASLVRAGGIVVMGYALKLLAWTFDHGAITEPRAWTTILLASVAMSALVFAFREPAPNRIAERVDHPRRGDSVSRSGVGWGAPSRLCRAGGGSASDLPGRRATHGSASRRSCVGAARARTIAGALGAVALVLVYRQSGELPRSPDVLVRLDVLHGIGAALAVLSVLFFILGRGLATERARAAVLVALALAVALATPHFMGVSLAPLPSRLADYVARTATVSGARFPLFPWLGHALYGACVGTLLRSAPRELGPLALPFARRPWVVALVALGVVAATFEAGPIATSITARAEWARPVLRLIFYGTAAMASAAALVHVRARALCDGLAVMGRSSLLVYGAHLELSYGLIGLPVRGALGWSGWAIAAIALTGLMVALASWTETRERAASTARRSAPDASEGRDATGLQRSGFHGVIGRDPGEG